MRIATCLLLLIGFACNVQPVWFFSKKIKSEKPCYPIVYSSQYNISFYGIENWLHSFDGSKYGKVASRLKDLCKNFYTVEPVSEQTLLKIHSLEYIKSLEESSMIAQVLEIPLLHYVPYWILKFKLLDAMRYAVSGTLLAGELALFYGYGINIGGGYHHAKRSQGEGFCIYNDNVLTIKSVIEKLEQLNKTKNSNKKPVVLYIDLDAHRGNGVESCLSDLIKTDKNKQGQIVVFDIFNKNKYPGNSDNTQQYITYSHPITQKKNSAEYIKLVKELESIIEETKPDFIFYNAGTDILQGDRLGGLSVEEDDIIVRDELVFTYAFEKKIPITMVTSGGYTNQSAPIISKSIKNILEKVVPKYAHLNKNLPSV